jgi:carbon-monoxide dehydrogenase medium subunit
MKSAAFDYRRAASAAEAVALLGAAGEGAKLSSGGQSLGAMLNLRLAQVDCLVDVRSVAALREFSLHDGHLRIGSGITHARIEDGELPDVAQGLLPFVAAGIAYRAVRNRGTVGGSLAHADPAADWVSVMRLLDARLTLLGTAGERSLFTRDFLLGPFATALAPDEVLVAIELPCFSPQARWAYRKVCRKPGEFADAIVAAWVDPGLGVHRVLLGALGGAPHVLDGAAELDALRDPATASDATARLLDDAGIDEAYERDIHAELLRRALDDLQHPPRRQP